ncbi:breast cancer anti-estrogen resistance protein 3 homolog isoform X3 [Palaemon carinicauda]|uniref:breast cancer anti-estrogen resistance protein 3 homolog isoform X3 n=1 Tax=Palaemon carinicauda TaxID=392227 RepID=UPI0035B6970A
MEQSLRNLEVARLWQPSVAERPSEGCHGCPDPHMDCKTWLTALDLPNYIPSFARFGGVEDVLYYDEAAIKELGIRHQGHRAKIMSSLAILREKYEKNHKLKGVDPNPPSESGRRKTSRRPLPPDPITHPDVILRAGAGAYRRNARKREAAILSPNTIGKMSFELDVDTGEVNNAEAGELKKLLEWELSLDAGDLRSHAWYHGTIPRVRAEEVVIKEGEFLIRDCISQPGDYVLTCRWSAQTLHFVIQKTVVQPNTVYERIQYQLEDEAYDTIPDLVRAYVGGKRPITISSGARISTPVNRTAPLSFYASKYALQTAHTFSHGTLTRPINRSSEPTPRITGSTLRHQHSYSGPIGVGCTIVRSPAHSPPRMRRDTAPILPIKTRNNSTSRASDENFEGSTGALRDEERSCSNDGVIGPRPVVEQNKFASQSLPRKMTTKSFSVAPEHFANTPSDPNVSMRVDLTPTDKSIDDKVPQAPPPKPSRVPSFKVKPKKLPQANVPTSAISERIYAEIDETEEDDKKDGKKQSVEDLITPTESGDLENNGKSIECGTLTADTASNPRHSRLSEMYQPSGSDSGNGSGDSVQTSASDTRNRDSQASFGDSGSVHLEEDSVVDEEPVLFTMPEMNATTAFDLENFSTLLLSSIENKPLDGTAMNGVKNTLLESGSRVLAAHLTRADLELLNGTGDCDLGLGVTSGIELVTLPHGAQLRTDLIERTECLKFFVAVTILMSPDLNERAEIIHRWIQMAIDTKTAMGNLYGFTGLMLGLCMPEIQRLTNTWHTVRQKYTDSAFNFESKLRSTLKAMNECTNPQAPNTTIPHLLPFMLLCERNLDDIYSMHKHGSSILQWESTAADYGLQMLFTHLQEVRAVTQTLPLYRRNADHILSDSIIVDDLTLDMFRSEFHLKFLWGSTGATGDSEGRHAKFQRFITSLSERCEPPPGVS